MSDKPHELDLWWRAHLDFVKHSGRGTRQAQMEVGQSRGINRYPALALLPLPQLLYGVAYDHGRLDALREVVVMLSDPAVKGRESEAVLRVDLEGMTPKDVIEEMAQDRQEGRVVPLRLVSEDDGAA